MIGQDAQFGAAFSFKEAVLLIQTSAGIPE
jgi:hypothetical protein